jgi:hypothetical protein
MIALPDISSRLLLLLKNLGGHFRSPRLAHSDHRATLVGYREGFLPPEESIFSGACKARDDMSLPDMSSHSQ